MRAVKYLRQSAIVGSLCLCTLLAAACPQQNSTSTPATGTQIAGATSSESVAALYNKNCAVCHGQSLEGRPGMAPALTSLSTNWKSPEELAKYLADPQSYTDKNKRLDAERGKYSMRMPANPALSEEQRQALAKWLLSL